MRRGEGRVGGGGGDERAEVVRRGGCSGGGGVEMGGWGGGAVRQSLFIYLCVTNPINADIHYQFSRHVCTTGEQGRVHPSSSIRAVFRRG